MDCILSRLEIRRVIKHFIYEKILYKIFMQPETVNYADLMTCHFYLVLERTYYCLFFFSVYISTLNNLPTA